MYQQQKPLLGAPIIQPSRYQATPNAPAQPQLFQGYLQPPNLNNQRLAQQGKYPHQLIVGQYSLPNQIISTAPQQRTTNSHIQPQNKGIAYIQQQPMQQSFNSKPPPLIQPPVLSNMEETHAVSQFFHQRAPMTQSNNEDYEDYNPHEEQQQVWTNEAQIASMYWQQRCMTMFQRFEWFYERFQILRNQYSSLSEEMQKMDSQEEWHRFQTHHDEFHEKIQEMEQELSAVLAENEQLIQQKQAQENQNVWEQRYQELLGNFKSLQEQMAHLNSSAAKKEQVPHEQYQRLQEHCRELEYRYGQALKQLQNYGQSKEPDTTHLEEQIHHYMQEIEEYKIKAVALHNQNMELQSMYSEVAEQYENLKSERTKYFGVDMKKYQDLVHQVESKEEQIKRLQDEFKVTGNVIDNLSQLQNIIAQRNAEIEQLRKDFQNKSREAEQRNKEAEHRRRELDDRRKEFEQKNKQLNTRNREIQELKKQLKDKEEQLAFQISDNRIKIAQAEEAARTKIKEEFQSQRRARDKKISELQRHVDELHTEVRKNSEHLFKAESLQKKLSYANQQNINLSEALKKKNQQLIELRSLTYELERLKEIQVEYYKVLDEREALREAGKKKQQEIQNLKQENEKLGLKIQEVANKRIQYNIRNLTVEIEDLNEQIIKKEAQISKFKSLGQVKQQYLEKVEDELRKAKSKIIVLQQSLESERQINREKDIQTSSKSSDYDKRPKNLDYEFNVQLKDTLEKEVASLRKQNVEKQQQIRRLQEQEVLLTSKLAIFQKQKDSFDEDVALLKKKQKQLQLVNEDQARKYKQLQRSLKQTEEDLKAEKESSAELKTYIANLKSQIQEHNTLIKSKNRTIEQLQVNISTRLAKLQQVDKLSLQNSKLRAGLSAAQQEIQNLKFADPQLSKSKALSTSNLHASKREFQRQQSIVISNLHQQNQKLKQQIARLLQRFTDSSLLPEKDSTKKVTANLNKRLTEFNSKLQYTISANDGLGLHQSQSQKLLLVWEKERRELINTYESELKSLKDQLTQVGKSNSRIVQSPSQGITKNLYESSGDKEIVVEKQKWVEQQQRISVLTRLNQELKSKLDSFLKSNLTGSALQYYKEQCEKSEAQNETLKQKIKALSSQNKQYKIQLAAKNAKLTQEFQFRIMQLEMVIQQNQRKIAYLQTEKASADNAKASLAHDLNIVNLDKSASKSKLLPKKEQLRYGEEPSYSSKYVGVEREFSSVLGHIPSTSHVPSYNYNFYDNQIASRKHLDNYGDLYSRSSNIKRI